MYSKMSGFFFIVTIWYLYIWYGNILGVICFGTVCRLKMIIWLLWILSFSVLHIMENEHGYHLTECTRGFFVFIFLQTYVKHYEMAGSILTRTLSTTLLIQQRFHNVFKTLWKRCCATSHSGTVNCSQALWATPSIW